MENIYRKTNSTVSLIHYQFVFCPRYRRKIFNRDDVEKRFKELVEEVCGELDLSLLDVECGKDYVHLRLNSLPTLSPANIMAKVKGVTSKRLREDFSHLEHLESLWTRSYLVTTEDYLSDELIQGYVSQQKKRG